MPGADRGRGTAGRREIGDARGRTPDPGIADPHRAAVRHVVRRPRRAGRRTALGASRPSSSTPAPSGGSAPTDCGSRRRGAGTARDRARSGWTSRGSATPTATRPATGTSATSTRPKSGSRWARSSTSSQRRGLGPRFVLIGLCAGGYWAFHTGAADSRVIEAIILNPRAMIWDAGPADASRGQDRPTADRAGTLGTRPARPGPGDRGWSKSPGDGADRGQRRDDAAAADRRPTVDAVRRRAAESLLDALRGHGTRVILGVRRRRARPRRARGGRASGAPWPLAECRPRAPSGRDHTLRPVSPSSAYRELLERELDRADGAHAGRG